MTAESYAWLHSEDRPGAWMREASCFSFLRSMTPEDVLAAAGLPDVRELDLTGRHGSGGRVRRPGRLRRWLARQVCEELGLDTLGWVRAALDSLEAFRPLPAPFTSAPAAIVGLDVAGMFGADGTAAEHAVRALFEAAATNPLHGLDHVVHEAMRATRDVDALQARVRSRFDLG